MKFFSEMPYDVVTTGNHELYKYPTALSTYDNVATRYGSRYVTSNVNITLPAEPGHPPQDVPLGNRFAKFKTEQGRNVTAFGPLFFFKGESEEISPCRILMRHSRSACSRDDCSEAERDDQGAVVPGRDRRQARPLYSRCVLSALSVLPRMLTFASQSGT